MRCADGDDVVVVRHAHPSKANSDASLYVSLSLSEIKEVKSLLAFCPLHQRDNGRCVSYRTLPEQAMVHAYECIVGYHTL
jgi:hypothetical protein